MALPVYGPYRASQGLFEFVPVSGNAEVLLLSWLGKTLPILGLKRILALFIIGRRGVWIPAHTGPP